jgi:hypothetical protein
MHGHFRRRDRFKHDHVTDPASGLLLRSFTYANAPSSYARGFEFNWEERFTELPGFLSGFGAGANATIFYEKYALAMRLAAYSVSADLARHRFNPQQLVTMS